MLENMAIVFLNNDFSKLLPTCWIGASFKVVITDVRPLRTCPKPRKENENNCQEGAWWLPTSPRWRPEPFLSCTNPGYRHCRPRPRNGKWTRWPRGENWQQQEGQASSPLTTCPRPRGSNRHVVDGSFSFWCCGR
ncbi:uncharacterized protein C1orf21 homolog isoform X1 [Tachyglossus aculeatus]|uniref:uncharacterized protein C1orf21 homolog isoform X1 n=1 Tax=Tachyglossus aculeatus TaxID=9261 RepID=UPI0018F458CB|nr:uncharacterized protein C1orf21 homolog isoform X1 [Tachyglossus aculeatus]